MEEQKHNGQFKKVIGLFGGISLVAGMTIGSGVYYLGSYVLERTDFSFGLALLCWVIGGVVSMLGGLCFAELGASRPVAGGMTVYLSEAYHPALGFINGFSCFILTCSGSIASLAMAAVESFRGTLGLNDLAVKIIAILIIIVFTAVNLRGAKLGVAFQNFTMVARVIPLVLIIFLGIFLGDNSVDMSLSMEGTRAEGGGITGAISLIGFATFASLWAYEGWTNLNTVGEEMKNPKRDLPRAIIISMGFITIIYTLFQFAIYRVLPEDQGGVWFFQRIYLGIYGWKDLPLYRSSERADPCTEQSVRQSEQGPEETRHEVHGFGHGVFSSSGVRDHQRPHGILLPLSSAFGDHRRSPEKTGQGVERSAYRRITV